MIITGYVEEEVANRFYAATDICLAPYSRKTNLSASGAITWALSSGKPTIASKIDAFQAIARDGDCMMMVTPEQPQELAWACECLDADEAMRKRLVANAGDYCRKYSWSDTAEQTIELYQRLLSRGAGQKNRISIPLRKVA
ncbi:MAG: glycosyltransferase [Pirellulales bacterium]